MPTDPVFDTKLHTFDTYINVLKVAHMAFSTMKQVTDVEPLTGKVVMELDFNPAIEYLEGFYPVLTDEQKRTIIEAIAKASDNPDKRCAMWHFAHYLSHILYDIDIYEDALHSAKRRE